MKPGDAAAIGIGAAVIGSLGVAYWLTRPHSVMDATAVMDAINSGQSLTVEPGSYPLPADFPGFKIIGQTQGVSAYGANFVYPHGFAGELIDFNDLTTGCAFNTWRGGTFTEDTLGLPYYEGITKLATGARFYSTSANGTYSNKLYDVVFNDPLSGIVQLEGSGTAFINNNAVEGVTVWHPQSYGIQESVSSAGNAFRDILMECVQPYGGPNLIGVWMDGNRNIHSNVWAEDCSGSQSTSQASASAVNPTIVGGNLLDFNFVNHGTVAPPYLA